MLSEIYHFTKEAYRNQTLSRTTDRQAEDYMLPRSSIVCEDAQFWHCIKPVVCILYIIQKKKRIQLSTTQTSSALSLGATFHVNEVFWASVIKLSSGKSSCQERNHYTDIYCSCSLFPLLSSAIVSCYAFTYLPSQMTQSDLLLL